MSIVSGIQPLDARIGGLREGELHILAGVPGSGRLVALLHFLHEGLSAGPVGMVTAAPPARIFDEARHWGLPLEEAWKEGRFRLLTLREDFERRLTSSAEPSEVYEELGELLGPGIRRLAIYPGTPLWDTRAGTSFASRFLQWIDGAGITTLATVGARLDDSLSPATDWVLQSAAGIFTLEVDEEGRHVLAIQRFSPAPRDTSPLLLDLEKGRGLVEAKAIRPRGPRLPAESERRVLLVNLAGDLPAEVRSWVEGEYEEVREIDDTFRAVELVQEDRNHFGIFLIHANRDAVGVSIRAARALRRLSPAPLLLFADEPVRAVDRVRALEAGANDFLSGPLSVMELATRVEHAVIAGGRAPAEGAGASGEHRSKDRTLLDREELAAELRRRIGDSRRSHFTLVHLRTGSAGPDRDTLGAALVDTLRFEDGDLVGQVSDGFAVVLQGTPAGQAVCFVDRVQSKLEKGAAGLAWKAYAAGVDRAAIHELLPELGTPDASLTFPRTGT